LDVVFDFDILVDFDGLIEMGLGWILIDI